MSFEFQERGSPHINSFISIAKSSILIIEKTESQAKWFDKMASAELPNDNDKIKLFGPVKTYQLHRHSKTCKNIHE